MRFEAAARRKISSMIAAGALVAGGAAAAVSIAAAPAQAVTLPSPPPLSQRDANHVTADALPTVQIDDGVVWSQAVVGNTVYAGGEFTNTRPAGAAKGTNLTPRSNLLAYDITTGALITSFAPTVNGPVNVVAVSPDNSALYIGGGFTAVNGVSRSHIAKFNLPAGTLDPNFHPAVAAKVQGIAPTNSTVYFGGSFTAVGGVTRSNLAAADAATGALTAWAPVANDYVQSMVMTPDGSKVIAAGVFQTINGANVYGLSALDPTTGAVLPWPATSTVKAFHVPGATGSAGFYSVRADNDSVYATAWNYNGGGNFEGTVRTDLNGNIQWLEDCHGDTYDSLSTNGVIYTIGHAHYCQTVNAWGVYSPWVIKHTLSWTKTVQGTLAHNTQGGYADFFGNSSPSQYVWYPDMTTGTYTGQTQSAWSLAGNSQYVVEGGEFPTVNNKAQYGLVRFAVPSATPPAQRPSPGGSNWQLALTAPTNSAVRVAWTAESDRDDYVITYKAYRDGAATPFCQTTVNSTWWNRPQLACVDTGLAPGSTHTYRVTATDTASLVTTSATSSITVPTTSPTGSLSAYDQQVINDGASSYWRLNEASGTTAFDSAGSADLTLGSGTSRGATGPNAGDKATTFNGTTSGTASTTAPVDAPNQFTLSAWVRTTSTAGGKIIGFGDKTSGNSAKYDRHIYIDKNGRPEFGVYLGTPAVVVGPTAVNDGQWHQIVASLGPNGMVLYVDGVRVAHRADVTSGQVLNGYWRVGGDNLASWPSIGTSGYLNGTIADVAVFSKVISPATEVSEYQASGRSLGGGSSAPAGAYGAAVYGDQPDMYWRLDDTSGTTAADASRYGTTGRYSGGYTLNQPSTAVGGSSAAVAFNGSTGTLASTRQFTNPATYSTEAWFKTTTTQGGLIVGFGSASSGSSASVDRAVYMSNAGKLYFGVNPSTKTAIGTASAFNNGAWHHVVATQGPSGTNLYVDGQLAASGTATTAQNFSGYWRVGGDALSGWPNNPTSGYFAGSIDEVAVYLDELSPAQVAAHYSAAHPPANNPPTAAFTSSANGLTVSVDGTGSSDSDGTIASYSWDFGDGSSGTGATTSHTYASGGTYTVTLTVTDNGGASNSVSHSVATGNQSPIAAFTYTTNSQTVNVDGSGSSDPDGTIASYAWNFGDGNTAAGATASNPYAAPGTYQVTLTVTDDKGASNAVTKSVTVSGPAIALDSFNRSSSGGWGTADVGGAWTATSTTAATKLSVSPGAGSAVLDAGKTVGAYLPVNAQDTNSVMQFSLDKVTTGTSAATYVWLASRHQTGNTEYRVRVKVTTGNAFVLSIMKTTSGADSALVNVTVNGLTFSPGTKYSVRFAVSGTSAVNLAAKLWPSGSAEPATAQATAADSTSPIGSGGSGLLASTSSATTNGPLTLSVYAFEVDAA